MTGRLADGARLGLMPTGGSPTVLGAMGHRCGLWRTTFEPPWVFGSRRWGEAGSQAPGGCAIKGNISRKGERIDHTPWSDRFYDRTRIDETKGERWFGSEKEAAVAGFRAPLLR